MTQALALYRGPRPKPNQLRAMFARVRGNAWYAQYKAKDIARAGLSKVYLAHQRYNLLKDSLLAKGLLKTGIPEAHIKQALVLKHKLKKIQRNVSIPHKVLMSGIAASTNFAASHGQNKRERFKATALGAVGGVPASIGYASGKLGKKQQPKRTVIAGTLLGGVRGGVGSYLGYRLGRKHRRNR